MNIEKFGPAHVQAVAAMHVSRLTGLLTALGGPFARAFYSAAAESKLCTGFVATENGEVVGFVVGGAVAGAFKLEAPQRRPFRTMFALLWGFARNPGTIAYAIRSQQKPAQPRPYDPMGPELTYLAVGAGRERSGIGRQLVDAFTAEMRKAGVPNYELSVDHDNRAAIKFYDELGFKEVARYTEFGVDRFRYRLTLGAGAQ